MKLVGWGTLAERCVHGDLIEQDLPEPPRQPVAPRLRLGARGPDVADRAGAAAPDVEPDPNVPASVADQVESALAREDVHAPTVADQLDLGDGFPPDDRVDRAIGALG